MPTHYSWKDVNGPGAITVPIAQVTPYMIALLKACLVSGYPGKPGAGWSVIYETDKVLYLQNANQSGIVAFYFPWTSQSTFRVYIMEGVPTDLTGTLPRGTNMRANVYSVESSAAITAQQMGVAQGGTPYRWAIVADENTFYLLLSSNILNYSQNGSSWPGQHKLALYVGELTSGQFVAIGGGGGGSGQYDNNTAFLGATIAMADGATNTPASACFKDLITGVIPPSYGTTKCLGLGGPVSTSTTVGYTQASENSPYVTTPLYMPEEVYITRPSLCYGGVPIPGNARMKGLVKPINLESFNYVFHYTFLRGAELTDLDDLFTAVDSPEYGEIIPFSGAPYISHCYWLMVDEEYW